MTSKNRKKIRIFKPFRLRYIIIFLLAALLITGGLPSIFASKPFNSGSISRSLDAHQGELTYGISEEKNELLNEKHNHVNSPEILNNTEKVLDEIEIVELEQESPVKDYNLENAEISNPLYQTPFIFDEIKKNPIVNNTTILDFLLGQPLNYYIFTRTQSYDTWTQGLLRRSIAMPDFNPSKWEYIDIDHNTSTGADDENTLLINDPHHEIRMRLSHVPFRLKDTQIPRPLQGEDGYVTLTGGLQIEVQKLVNSTFELEAYIVKSISYEGINYIWTIGLEFQDTPDSFNLTIIADSVKLIGGKLREIIPLLLSLNFSRLNELTLADINGPYTLNYWTEPDISSVAATVGLVKIENYTMSDKTWIQLRLDNSESHPYIPHTGEVFLDSLNVQAPIDKLKWTAGANDAERIPLILTIKYSEEREELVYATVVVRDMPGEFEFVVDYTKTVDDFNVTIVDYYASAVVDELEYNGYIYPYYRSPNGMQYFNISHLKLYDVPTQFHVETTTDLTSQINTSTYYTPQVGLVANLIDNLVMKLANRLYRIGKYLTYAAESVMTLPSSKGYVEVNAYNEHFGTIEFHRSSGNYINRAGDFIAFFDDSYVDPLKYNDPDHSLINIAISGRLSDLQYLNISFTDTTHLEIKLLGGREFNTLIIKGNEFTHAHFSNLPGYARIDSDISDTVYSTIPLDLDELDESDPSYDKELNRISEFKIVSVVGEQYLQLKITDIPNEMTFKRPPGNIVFNVSEGDAIGSFEFQITNNSKFPLYGVEEGHYAYVSQTRDYNMGSGRISGIKHIEYNPEQFGRFRLELEKESKFQIIFKNELDANSKTSGRLIIDPLPNEFSMDLPGIANRSEFLKFPEVTNVTDITEFSNIFFVLGNLGNEIIDLMGNISNSLIQSIGNIGTNFAFSYSLDSYNEPMDIIADIERGNWDEFEGAGTEAVGWTHGISLAQREFEGNPILKAHMYLQGMPQQASFESRVTGNNVYLKLDFDDYSPDYDWLLIDISGVQERDVVVYLTGIQPNIDFYAEANFTMNLSVGGEIVGNIHILTTEANVGDYSIDDKAQQVLSGNIPGVDLGQLYIKMTQFYPILSLREIIVSQIPARFFTELALTDNLNVKHESSDEIEYIYTKLSKFTLGSWHHSYVIFHELPSEFELTLTSNNRFDIDKPLPLQGLPTIKVDTVTPEMLDIYIFLDGKTIGQRTNYEVFIGDAPNLLATLKDDVYKFRSLGGKLGALKLKLTNLPLTDDYKIKYIELIGENIVGFDFKINTLFGVLPYFELSTSQSSDDAEGGRLEVNLHHKIKLFGSMVEAQVALVDIVYSDAGGGNIPTSTPIYFNSIAMDMTKSKNNIIIPALIISIYSTMFQ